MNNINKTLKKSLLILLPFCLMGGAGLMAAIDFSFGVGHGGYRRGHGYYNKGYRYYGPHYRHHRPYRYNRVIYVNPTQQYNYAMPSDLVSMKNRQYNIMENLWGMDLGDRERKIRIRSEMEDLSNRFIREYRDLENLLNSRNYDRIQRYRSEKEDRLYEMNREFMDKYDKFNRRHQKNKQDNN